MHDTHVDSGEIELRIMRCRCALDFGVSAHSMQMRLLQEGISESDAFLAIVSAQLLIKSELRELSLSDTDPSVVTIKTTI